MIRKIKCVSTQQSRNTTRFISSVANTRRSLYDEHQMYTNTDASEVNKEIIKACKRTSTIDQENLHYTLAKLYKNYFEIPEYDKVIPNNIKLTQEVIWMLEDFLSFKIEESVTTCIKENEIPRDSKRYIKWLIRMINEHRSTYHPFYNEFMKNEAKREDIKFWLAQESILDPRFADIIALLQVGKDGGPKMEFAKNYWDEMGNGSQNKTHSLLFSKLSEELNVTEEYINNNITLMSLISGNISSFYAIHRRNYYKALGYFGVTEYLAPGRFKNVVLAMKRCGISPDGMEYHKLHVMIDTIHGAGWINNVIRPMVEYQPETVVEISKGVMVRLDTSALHLDSLLEHLKK